MQILNVLTKFRKEMAETERAITQAWQRYSKELSTKALAEAEATTKRLAVLHRRLASRLEQIAGEGRRRWAGVRRHTATIPRWRMVRSSSNGAWDASTMREAYPSRCPDGSGLCGTRSACGRGSSHSGPRL
jgi:hypothetical protein